MPCGRHHATVAASNVDTSNIAAALTRMHNLPTKPNCGNNPKYHLVPGMTGAA